MYKVLVTTWIVDLGIQSKAAAVHTLLIEFHTQEEADFACTTINNSNYDSYTWQRAKLLTKPLREVVVTVAKPSE